MRLNRISPKVKTSLPLTNEAFLIAKVFDTVLERAAGHIGVTDKALRDLTDFCECILREVQKLEKESSK